MILLIDNYDSFSYNLYQAVGACTPDIRVVRNDMLTVRELAALAPDRIILSPGPGHPEDAGICIEAVRKLGGRIPILGVCLGHQGICEAFGGMIVHAEQLMHGKQSEIAIETESPLFVGLPSRIRVARYHSLTADPATIPGCLRVIGSTDEGGVMAVEHREFPVYGVQFHPESILTPDGPAIIKNFLGLPWPK